MRNDSSIPGILKLPVELRDTILIDVLSSGVRNWLPSHAIPVFGFPLHGDDPLGSDIADKKRIPQDPPCVQIGGILLSCKQLYAYCLALLADNFTFMVHINARDDAPTGANSFRHIHILTPSFRDTIKSLALLVSFRVPDPDGHFKWAEFGPVLDRQRNPLLFEKIVESINELLHFMPGVESIHLVWGMFFGDSVLTARKERYTRWLRERLRKEWPAREIKWTGQHCMGSFVLRG